MKKYKCLSEIYDGGRMLNKIFDEDYTWGSKSLTVGQWAAQAPCNWKLVEDEFVLPEKWCVCPVTEENLILIKKWIGKYNDYRITNTTNTYTSDKTYFTYLEIALNRGYTEITFEQFKEHVLKQPMEEKKIIGYKLIRPEYKDLVVKALQLSSVHEPNIIMAGMIAYYIPKIKELGVMDWFTPVYEEEFKVGDWVLLSNNAGGWGTASSKINNKILQITEIDHAYRSDKGGVFYFNDMLTVGKEIVRKATPEEIAAAQAPQITINGYKAEFFDWGVKFGCQDYKKEFVIELWECLKKNNFSMDHKDQIKQIAEYYLNK